MRTTNRTRHNASTRTASRRPTHPSPPVLTGPDGKPVRLSDLPLVAYWLTCGCTGRTYGIETGDLLFCDEHADRKRVMRTLS